MPGFSLVLPCEWSVVIKGSDLPALHKGNPDGHISMFYSPSCRSDGDVVNVAHHRRPRRLCGCLLRGARGNLCQLLPEGGDPLPGDLLRDQLGVLPARGLGRSEARLDARTSTELATVSRPRCPGGLRTNLELYYIDK